MIRFKCPVCQEQMEAPEDLRGEVLNCPKCREPVKVSGDNLSIEEYAVIKKNNSTNLIKRTIETYDLKEIIKSANFILVGVASMLMISGVFMPVVKVPILGDVNYFQNGQGDGVFIVILALIAVTLALSKKYLLNLIPSILISIILLYFFLNVRNTVSGIKQSAEDSIIGGLTATLVEGVQIQFGWAVIILGNIMLYISVLLKPKNTLKKHMPLWNIICLCVLFGIGILAIINQEDSHVDYSASNSSHSIVSKIKLEKGSNCTDTSVENNTQPKYSKEMLNSRTNASFFGIRLGDTLSNVKRGINVVKSDTYQFTDKDTPAEIWEFSSTNPAVKEMVIGVFQNRVYQIEAHFSEVSETNYNALKSELSHKYGTERDLGLDGIVFGGEKALFTQQIDGIEVYIFIKYSSGFADDELFIKYVHVPLSEKVEYEKMRIKTSGVKNEL